MCNHHHIEIEKKRKTLASRVARPIVYITRAGYMARAMILSQIQIQPCAAYLN